MTEMADSRFLVTLLDLNNHAGFSPSVLLSYQLLCFSVICSSNYTQKDTNNKWEENTKLYTQGSFPPSTNFPLHYYIYCLKNTFLGGFILCCNRTDN